jgi:hypothetical protein
MRSLFLLPLAFALSLLSGCATNVASGYKLQPHQIDDIKGVFMFDDGTTLKISNVGRKLYAELGQRGKAEMVPVAENHFVVPDQHMTMEYRPSGFGDEIVLTYPVDVNAASGEMVTARLAVH